MRRASLAVGAAALAAACAGLRFENEPALELAVVAFRLPGSGWTSGPVEARRGLVAVVEVPGGEAVGGFLLELEFRVEAISIRSAHVLFHGPDALAWPAGSEARRYGLGEGWLPVPWSNADGESPEAALLEVHSTRSTTRGRELGVGRPRQPQGRYRSPSS